MTNLSKYAWLGKDPGEQNTIVPRGLNCVQGRWSKKEAGAVGVCGAGVFHVLVHTNNGWGFRQACFFQGHESTEK